MPGMPNYHKKVTKMTINLKKLEGFKKEEQLVFILAHIRDIAWTYPKETEKLMVKFPVLKEVPTNHNLLYAEIYETIFNQQSFAEDNNTHFKREITKIGDAVARLTAACYKEKAKMLGSDKTIMDMERELAKPDKETSHAFRDPAEETSAHIDEMDLTKDEEHVVTGKKGNAKKKKAKAEPKTKTKGTDVETEPPMMNRPFIMIPSKMRPPGPQGQ